MIDLPWPLAVNQEQPIEQVGIGWILIVARRRGKNRKQNGQVTQIDNDKREGNRDQFQYVRAIHATSRERAISG
jgi:hypothetical protein